MNEENKKEEQAMSNEQQVNDEIISSTALLQQETSNQQQATENMEVHHHPHVGKKNFKEYFLEFLMIFLAVTMGFIAENLRERITDNEREKQYMESLIKDIKDDISFITDQQSRYETRQALLDSLINNLNTNAAPASTNDLYYYARLASKNDVFPVNTRTFDQMKNAGGFRVIKNDQVVSAIMSYYVVLPQIQSLEETEQSETNEYRKIAVQIFSAVVFNQINSTSEVIRPVNNPHLRTTDNKLWGDLSGWVHYIKNTRIGLNVYKKEILERGQKLIQLIQKEYHLDNE